MGMHGVIRDISLTPEGIAEVIGKLNAVAGTAGYELSAKASESPLLDAWGLLERSCELIYASQQLQDLLYLQKRVAGGSDILEAGSHLRQHCLQQALQSVGDHGSNERANLATNTQAQAMRDLAEALKWALGE